MDQLNRNRIILTNANKIIFGKEATELQYQEKLKKLLDKEDYLGAAKLKAEAVRKGVSSKETLFK